MMRALVFDQKHPPFEKVRQAFAHAIDQKRLIWLSALGPKCVTGEISNCTAWCNPHFIQRRSLAQIPLSNASSLRRSWDKNSDLRSTK
ncbi:MAG: hypothetical protein EOS85_30835 [Mesorhizobium sp.]|nr:MAG: hypothetical protein EOS85_30835 [Mesorhizobium sp.]